MTVEIGRGKSGRRAYSLDEIGIVPSRRTRDPEEVSTAWQIDAYRFELPLVVCPMDSAVSPATAVAIGRLGGLAVLDLEGLWTRYEDPEPVLAQVASLDDESATRRLQEIYSEPIKEDLIGRRISEIRAAGVLAGFGGGSGHTTAAVLGVAVPMATAIADVAAARRDYLDESGGRYVHVIADGGMTRSGDIAKALACGADAVMVGSPFARAKQAPGRGYHWGSEAHHPDLPRGARVKVGTVGTLEQILCGPSAVADGSLNLIGALRRTMAISGYSDLKEFQRVEVVVTLSAPPRR